MGDAWPVASVGADRRRAGGGDEACLLVMDIAARGVRSVTVPQADFIAAFDCDATGARLLWAASDNTLALWDLDRDERVVHCRGHTGKVNAVAIVDAGRYAVSCSSDRTLRLWNLARGEVEAALTTDAGLRSLAVAADGRTFAVGDVSGRVHLVRPERGDGSVLSPT